MSSNEYNTGGHGWRNIEKSGKAQAAECDVELALNMQKTNPSKKMSSIFNQSLYDHHPQHEASIDFGGDSTANINQIASGTSFTGGEMQKLFFTLSQLQEFENQKMIYKHIMSSIPIPPQLLLPLSTQYNRLDSEPWRCRRTDGKKWRCSRDVMPDQKYCERHAHKNRLRSRKPVETQSQNTKNINNIKDHNNYHPPTTSCQQSRCTEWYMKGVSSSHQKIQKSMPSPSVGSKRGHYFQNLEGCHDQDLVEGDNCSLTLTQPGGDQDLFHMGIGVLNADGYSNRQNQFRHHGSWLGGPLVSISTQLHQIRILKHFQMGCATSHLLNHDEDFTKFGSSAFSHHIVSLTSTTYGLLTLDPSSSKTKTTISIFPTPGSEPISEPPPEVINSWELMAGLDSTTESFRLYRQPSNIFHEDSNTLDPKNPAFQGTSNLDHNNPAIQENSNVDEKDPIFLLAGLDSKTKSFRLYRQPSNIIQENSNLDPIIPVFRETSDLDHNSLVIFQENSNVDDKIPIFLKSLTPKRFSLDEFENLCPPKGENKIVVYTATLRGVRKTFEACNTVRTVLEGYRVFVSERDISMDSGFREELRYLMKGKDSKELVPPRVFVKGRYVGGVDAVVKAMEDGSLDQLLQGLPKSKNGYVCEGCGGVRFLPCFTCNGSCKMVDWKEEGARGRKRVGVRCSDCNENGLVHCPICS